MLQRPYFPPSFAFSRDRVNFKDKGFRHHHRKNRRSNGRHRRRARYSRYRRVPRINLRVQRLRLPSSGHTRQRGHRQHSHGTCRATRDSSRNQFLRSSTSRDKAVNAGGTVHNRFAFTFIRNKQRRDGRRSRPRSPRRHSRGNRMTGSRIRVKFHYNYSTPQVRMSRTFSSYYFNSIQDSLLNKMAILSLSRRNKGNFINVFFQGNNVPRLNKVSSRIKGNLRIRRRKVIRQHTNVNRLHHRKRFIPVRFSHIITQRTSTNSYGSLTTLRHTIRLQYSPENSRRINVKIRSSSLSFLITTYNNRQ